ncbi:MAG: DUF2062 domain-containing protein [Opitutales bacterium]|nr:DUF2062 domain-containing protein [Opitutales bacterium]
MVVALQFITNPLTVIPIYFTAFQIGRLFLRLFGVDGPWLQREWKVGRELSQNRGKNSSDCCETYPHVMVPAFGQRRSRRERPTPFRCFSRTQNGGAVSPKPQRTIRSNGSSLIKILK